MPVFRLFSLAWLLCAAWDAQAQAIAAPVLSIQGGIYASPQSVAIMEATSGTAVYYTTDGTTPTASSFVYAGPISVNRTATIHAVAIAPDGGRSAVASGIYDLHKVVPVVATIAGDGAWGYSGDDGPAIAARLQHPLAVTIDRSGNVYIADAWNSVVRKVSQTGIIATIAGNGTAGLSGDGGPAGSARLNNPTGIAVDSSGNVFIADAGNNRIRMVSPAGIITTVAGNGTAGFGGDGGPATRAELRNPVDVALDASGNLFIADASNQRVRKVTPAGAISTVAGNGIEGFSGDGGAATEAALDLPSALAFDRAGNLFIADSENYRVRNVAPSGLIATVAGNGTAGFSGDGGTATEAELNHPAGVAVDAAGNLYISDGENHRVRVVMPSGAISTVAGDGTAHSTRDGGPARDAGLTAPGKIAVDAEGNLYIPDAEDQRVRKMSFQPAAAPAPAAHVAVFGTGYVAGGPGLAPVGTLDGNFSLISCPAGACANQPYITLTGQSPFPQWLPNTGTAQWIGPDAGGDQTHIDPSGLYDYRESFDLTGFVPGSVVLSGAYATDNSGSILLNGVAVGPASSSFRSSTPFTLDSGFQAGTNTLDFLVSNTPSECCTDPTGLFVELSGTGQLVGQLSFGTMTFSPAAAELQGTSQAVTIGDTLAYSGSPPTGAVAYVLNGVGYTANCTGAASPETCTAIVPAATIAALPGGTYPVTGSFAGDAEYPPATAPPGTFSIAAAASCAVPNPGNGTMNIAYYTVAESDRDGGTLPAGVSSNYVLPALGPNGLPVYNPHATATAGSIAAPRDLLPDGEITWWSPTLNDGGPGGTSDVVQTGTGVVSLPFANNNFYPPNGTGANDFHGFQAAILTGTFVAPASETVSFTIASDDMAFLYLDGQIACDDGGVHPATAVPCTTSVIPTGTHTLAVFYVDLNPVDAVLDFTLTTSNVSIGTLNPVSFGAMTFSPAATEPFGSNQAITISDTLAYSGPQPTGAVAFVLNGVSYKATCTGSVSPETCTAVVPAATIAALPAADYAVAGSFAEDCNYAAATAASGTFTIAKDSLTFGTMTFSPAATEPYTTSQSIAIGDTLFYSNAQPLGAVTYALNGVSYTASCTGTASPETCTANVPAATIAALQAASYPVTGSFAGDSDYSAATARPGTFTVTQATLAFGTMTFAPAATETYGTSQLVTIEDTLSYSGARPTGAVAYVLNRTTYTATCTTTGSPETCTATVPAATIAALPAAVYSVSGSFLGDGNYAPATAASGTFAIAKAQPSFGTMTFSPAATEPYGTSQLVTIGDTLKYSGTQPAGAVAYVLNGVSYAATCTGVASPETCSATVPASTVAALSVAAYPVSGTFAGDANYTPATASPGTFTIAVATTRTALAASSTSLTFGQTLTLTATVSTATSAVPAGKVAFQNGAASFNNASLNASGAASISSNPAVGTYSFTASYAGSADDLPSTSSPPLTVTVAPAPSVTTLASSLNPAPDGSTVTLAISVRSPGGTPSGSVTLSDGATVLAILSLNQAGSATFSTSSLLIGTHSLTASYAGSGNFSGSQDALAQVVLAPPTFTIAASGPLTLVTQHHGPITIAVTPVNGFSGTVALSCGALPPYATCEWASAELTSTSLPVSGGPASVQLVIDTSAVLGYESSSRTSGMGKRELFAGLLFPVLLLLYRRRRSLGRIAICCLALLSALNLSGCSIKDPGSTPPGTYSITILGTSGTIQSTGTLTLIVTN